MVFCHSGRDEHILAQEVSGTTVLNVGWSLIPLCRVARAPPAELKDILSLLPPFVPKYDIPRGIASLGTKVVHYTLMLIVM